MWDDPKDIAPIIADLEKNKDQITGIELSSNSIGIECAKVLANAIQSLSKLEKVNYRDIFVSRLKEDLPISLEFLMKAIMDKKIKFLDLSDNAFGPTAIHSFDFFLKENETLEEKNMINISHYVDASPEALSEKSNGSLERKMQTSQKAKKSRNKSNINITTTTEDLSFKTELRNNINLKIKKRMAQNAIPHNNNSSSSNIDIKKKSNLMNFLSHANVINKNTNYNSIQTINNIKSISPKGKKRAQTGHHQHYKSFNNENNILSGEKSMCNLPSYSLGKVKIGDSRMKTSLNDLGVSTNMNGKSYSKGKFIKIISSSTNKQKKPNSVSKKSITKGFSNKSSYNILAENNSGLSNDFEKYKSNLMSKIGFSNANSGSNNNTGFNYLCNHNIKGIMNIKMNINK